ncbi:hypothetical protein TGARI_372490, partial [Toxoplasma gondii ARI]
VWQHPWREGWFGSSLACAGSQGIRGNAVELPLTGDMCWYIERCTATPSGLLLFFLAARGVICGIVCSMISAGGGWQCWCCLARFVLACTSGSSDADAGSVFPWGARLTQEICVRLLRDPHSYRHVCCCPFIYQAQVSLAASVA